MKYTPRTFGLFQAAGLTLYVAVFALAAWCFVTWADSAHFEPQPIFAISIFLLAFIISATICASIMFGYPVSLFFGNKKKEAIEIIVWSVGWLVLFFMLFLVASLSLFMSSY